MKEVKKKPNILFIMADQLKTGVLGPYGDKTVIAPAIDALAGNGAVFENCYCNNPICVPSRASMVAGMYSSSIGVYDNGCELPASQPTFMHLLRDEGYKTILCGKMHFIGPDQLHGFEERLITDIYPSSLEWTPDWDGGPVINGGSNVKPLKNSGPCKTNLQVQYDDEVQFLAIDALRNQARRLQSDHDPFFLCVSFTNPHDPFTVPEEWWNMYENMDIPMPETGMEDREAAHIYNQWLQYHHGVYEYPLEERDVMNSRRAYYGMVSYLDAKVGELIKELKRLGLDEDTIVIFTSDHGEMLGEHGMWFKRTFYDDALKVPMIVSWPGVVQPGCRIGNVMSLLDLFPTFCEIADVDAGKMDCLDIQGRSFVSLLRDDTTEWTDEAIAEYLGEGVLKPVRIVRDARYKYVYVESHESLLFDMEEDPNETVNLAGKPEYREIELQLKERVLKDWNGASLDDRIRRSQKQRKVIGNALSKGEYMSWDYKAQPDARRRYIKMNAQYEKGQSRFPYIP